MDMIHVCALSMVENHIGRTGATHLVTLLGPKAKIERPALIPAEQHLRVGISDIVSGPDDRILPEHERDGHILAEQIHVEQVIAFARDWHHARGRGALLIHCYAGVSRSTAAAYISALAIDPARDDFELARMVRHLSPTASPNRHLIAIADRVLKREGRMIAAIEEIGRGIDCFEGIPFALTLTPL